MNKELIKNAIEAFKNFIAACGNDVCNNADQEYLIFAGSVAADDKGNLKTYSPSGELVAQVPLRPILDNASNFGIAVVDLIEADEKERAKKAEEEAQVQAEADKAENQEIENKIEDLQSEISNLKLRKKAISRYVKQF